MNFQNQIDYGQEFGIDVLSGVPEIAPLNRDTLKSHIVLRCGLLIPLYSEPETMQAAISHWFSYNHWNIEKMVELLAIEYDPLENYHRHEKETLWQHGEDKDSRTITEQGTIKDNRSIKDTGTISDDGGSTTENTVSAYNSDDYEPEAKQEITNGNERTLDTERSDDNTRTLGSTHKDDNTSTRQNDERNNRETWGNIGTMTSQSMFMEQVDLVSNFNLYDWIVDRIEAELFLGIW